MRLASCVAICLTAIFATALPGTNAEIVAPHPTSRFVKVHSELPSTGIAIGAPKRDRLKGPEVRRFTFEMRAGQFAAIKVRQTAGNVACALFDPAGRLVDLADRAGDGFDETLVLTATTAGTYAVQIAQFAWDTPSSAFEIELVQREAAATTPAGVADQLMTAWYDPAYPGAAVQVVRDGKILFRRAIGLANVDDRVAITPATRFDLASLSKQFTAYAVAILVDRGLIALDDDVRRYLPEIPRFAKTITIRHLLDHTSGLRDWDALFGLMGRSIEDGITKEAILDVVSRQTELNFAPGTAQQYSNTGYSLLAEIVARVTKEPFETWIQNNVFSKSGMTAVANGDPEATISGRALSYGKRYPLPHLVSGRSTASAGSSSVHASLRDLAAWAAALDDGGVGGPNVKRMTSQPDRLDDGTKLDYGFGQWFGDRAGIAFAGHLGLAAGYRTSFRRFPSKRLAVIFLANDGDDVTYSRAKIIENLFLGIPADPVEVPDGEYEPPKMDSVSPSDGRNFAGVYYSAELRTAYEISADALGLGAYHSLNGRIRLVREKDDTFHSDRFFMPTLVFDRDAHGTVLGLRVSTEGARNIFFKKLTP